MPSQPVNWSAMLEGQDPAAINEARFAVVAPNTQLGAALGISGGFDVKHARPNITATKKSSAVEIG